MTCVTNETVAHKVQPNRALDSGTGNFHAPDVPIRDHVVATAVTFLSNPRVQQNTEEKKRLFLASKGLTAQEIDVAIEYAKRGIPFFTHNNNTSLDPIYQFHEKNGIPMVNIPPVMRHEFLYQNSSVGTMALSRALVPSLLITYGICYGIYWLYNRFLKQLFVGREEEKAKHPLVQVQESIQQLMILSESLNNGLQQLEDNIVFRLKKEMESLYRPTVQEVTAVSEIRKEVASVKALLLGRKQFPESPAIPAAIPAWQLTDDSKERQ